MTRDAGGLTLVYAWFRPYHVFMLFFCIVWGAFLVFWYRTALAHPSPSSIALWFPLLHVAVGVGITYSTIAGFLNRTRVGVNTGEITIRHGPLPWIGNSKVPAGEIRQLFREEIISTGNNGRSASYHLNAIIGQNRKLRLIRNIPAADMALYLEQEIEKALGIEDRRVAGEMPK